MGSALRQPLADGAYLCCCLAHSERTFVHIGGHSFERLIHPPDQNRAPALRSVRPTKARAKMRLADALSLVDRVSTAVLTRRLAAKARALCFSHELNEFIARPV